MRHIRYDDREDWLHDAMLEMAKVKAKYEVTGKPLTEAGLMRVASYQVTEYWVKQRRLTTWLDCGHCSKAQRQKCRSEDLYSGCPKYHQLVSLNAKADGDGGGEPSELIEFIADDKAIDLDQWLDDKTFLAGCPQRLIGIALKIRQGQALTPYERLYLYRFRKREQKRLIK